MDTKERAQLVRELRLDLKAMGADSYHGSGGATVVVGGGDARRRARKRKITRGNQAMHRRFYSDGGHDADEVFGWDNPNRRKY